jgi:hypothetical protein
MTVVVYWTPGVLARICSTCAPASLVRSIEEASQGHALRPILHRLLVGKSSSPQSSLKIGNGFLRNGNVKRTNFFGRVGYQRFKGF